MSFGRATRKLIGWMACSAFLWAAVAPAISHALVLVSGSGPTWAEICSTAGFKRVQFDASGKAGEPATPASAMGDHCPHCTLQSHDMAPPPVPVSVVAPVALSFEVPTLFLAAPRTQFAWAAAQARAPPQHS